jgi:Phage integrase, N-terminal SAM-like domain
LYFAEEYIRSISLLKGMYVMKVQRVKLDMGQVSWMVLDDNYVPVQPILSYLKFLQDLERSPNTRRATAHHLKLFWEYLRDEHLCWTEINLAQLAGFIPWLRRPDPSVVSIKHQQARRSNATIDQTIGSVQSFYAFHARLGTVPQLPLYQLSLPDRRGRKRLGRGTCKRAHPSCKIPGTHLDFPEGTHCFIGGNDMTEEMNHVTRDTFDQLVEHYLGLESMEVTEELLDLCGASIDTRALVLLKRRLREEEALVPVFEARGYIRMREKSEQLIASLKPLIAALEEDEQ